ncbi:MAG: hypothetical protein IPM53_11910 [Anaerolineaceae bacterium]|nr:hypothetical protein [Anaerolineaceae bacterium]
MTFDELKRRLHDAGCSTTNYHLGEPQGATDVICLAERNGRFHIFYTERGQDHPPEKTFDDEAAACRYFHDFVMNMRHDHLVGYYQSAERLQQHASFLEKCGIVSTHDIIPYRGWADPRYRLFVEGPAIFTVRQLLPSLPLDDQAELPHAD